MDRPIVRWIVVVGLVIIVVIGVFIFTDPSSQQNDNLDTSYNGIEILPDLRKDTITPLSNPAYENANSDITWLSNSDLVVGIDVDGDARAYPVKIMSWHEVVNDVVGSQNIAVTYNPLCASAVAYSANINDQTLEFGNTGSVYNGCSVMYDKQTNSYWNILTGQSIRGEFIDQKLTKLPTVLTTWQEWRALYPQSQVLSINTGLSRNYISDPYKEYIDDPEDTYPMAREDDRLNKKDLIIGLEINGKFKAYPVKQFKAATVTDNFEGQEVQISGDDKGQTAVLVFKDGDKSTLGTVTNSYWFAWSTNYPETSIFE